MFLGIKTGTLYAYNIDESNFSYAYTYSSSASKREETKYELSFHLADSHYRIFYDQSTNKILCFKDDHIIWNMDLDYIIIHMPLVDSKALYIQNQKGMVYCIDLETGNNIWITQVGNPNIKLISRSRPQFYQENDKKYLIVVSGYFVHMIDVLTGSVVFMITPQEEYPVNMYGESLIYIYEDGKIAVTQENLISWYSLKDKKRIGNIDIS